MSVATQPIKTRFELDGEKEYKAAVSEINASLRVLNSEMKLVSEQFKNNDKRRLLRAAMSFPDRYLHRKKK